jgi:NAD(P)-dependent dehydrogenase (short-subunit alcohol dehydrogenase family)
MSTDLTGRVAIVTGGSRGLGRAMAGAFACAGATVVVASRRLDSCVRAAEEITEETGARTLPLAFHAGHWDEAGMLVDTVLSELGRLDVLVNNAGMSPLYDDLDSVTEALWDKVFDVNLKGPFRLGTLAARAMRRTAGQGSIINISSMASLRPRPDVLPYAAAKAGLNTMTVAMARAFGPDVRVNAIVAGTFMTDVSRSWDAEAFAERARGFAMRRGGRPEEICGAALYLAGDDGSFTTGSLLTVDGGQP